MPATPRGISLSRVAASDLKIEFGDTGMVRMLDYVGEYGFPNYRPIAYSDFHAAIGMRVGEYTLGDIWGYNHPQVEGEDIGSLHAGTSVTTLSGEKLLLYTCLEYDLKSSLIYVVVLLGVYPSNQPVLLSINGCPLITTLQYSQNATFSYYMGTTGQGTPLLKAYKGRDVRVTLDLGTTLQEEIERASDT